MAGFVDKIKRMWDSPDDEYEYDDYSYEDNNKDSYDDEDSYEEQREHQREVRRSERSERRKTVLRFRSGSADNSAPSIRPPADKLPAD